MAIIFDYMYCTWREISAIKYAVAVCLVFCSYLEEISFFEVNIKYMSSNVLKISVISRGRSTSKIADIFNTFDEIFWVFTDFFP